MNKPVALKQNDKVAIVSLSGGLLGEPFCSHDIPLAKKRLEEFGLEMVFMPNALKGMSYLREHPEARAADLKQAFSDDSIRAIICAIGGDDTYKLLPYLLDDEEFIDLVKNNPKIFTGFSDSTVNHLMFYKLGMVSYYGPNVINDLSELADDMLPYTKEAFGNYIKGKGTGGVSSSPKWYEERTDFSPNSMGTDRKTHDETHGFELLNGKSVFSGELLGGCLDTLFDILSDTENVDMKETCERYGLFPTVDEWRNKIMFIETSENCMPPDKLVMILQKMDEMGIISTLNGIIVGKPQNENFYEEYKGVYTDFFKRYPELPVVYNVNFGHAYPRAVLPYGISVEVNAEMNFIKYLESIVD